MKVEVRDTEITLTCVKDKPVYIYSTGAGQVNNGTRVLITQAEIRQQVFKDRKWVTVGCMVR